MARYWNCSDETTQEAVDCLRQIDGIELDDGREGGYSVVLDNFISDPFLSLVR